jgi:anti-sigma factor RsiW
MRRETDSPSDRDEIEMLLPWYATGKLESADRKRVEAYLDADPEMRERLKLTYAERTETTFLNGPVPATSAAAADRFMAQIAAEEKGRSRGQAGVRSEGFLARLASMLSAPFPGPVPVQWGAALAAIVILVQAVSIGALIVSRPNDSYELAAGPGKAAAPGRHVLVRFAPNATAERITATLTEMKVTLAGGPRAGGLFTLRIGPEQMSDADSERMIAALRGHPDIFTFVTPTQ